MEIVTAALTTVLVIITGYYAWVTRKILEANERSVSASQEAVKAMREQTEAVYRPYITIKHRLTSNALLDLVIENTGETNAVNLKLEIDKDYYQAATNNEEYNLANLYAFNNVIETFPPGAKLAFSLGAGLIIRSQNTDQSQTPLDFKISATYSFGGKTVTETTTVDLHPYARTFTNPELNLLAGLVIFISGIFLSPLIKSWLGLP